MKHLYTLFLAACGLWVHAQTPIAMLMGSVTDSSGAPVANQLVTLTATPTPGTAGSTLSLTYTTSASGIFGDSLQLPSVMGTVVVSTLNCNGLPISSTFNYSPNTGSVMTWNCTFVLCSAGGGGGGGGTPLTCNALFVPDSNQVNPGLVHLVNACSTTYSGPAATTTTAYAWSFGDGGTATGAYPSHFYSAPGTYGVCVTMASTTSNGFTCTDTFCDSITIDSTGFLVFKNQAGFTLQVIDASQLTSIEYPELALHVLPNPAGRGTRLTWASNAAVERVELSDLQGRVLCTGTAHLDTEGLPAGTYVLQATTPWGPVSQRVVLVP
ncbi:MAG: hypothetical protein RL276_1244 [Bacteroidota bacterium]